MYQSNSIVSDGAEKFESSSPHHINPHRYNELRSTSAASIQADRGLIRLSALFALALLLSACSPSAPDLKGCDEEFDIVVPDLMICEEGCRIRVRDGRVEITSLDPGDEIRSEVYHWDDDGMLHRVSKTGWPPIITHDLLGKNRRPE